MDSTSPNRLDNPTFAIPADHVRVLHSAARVGTVTIAQRAGQWRERSIPLRDLTRYVQALPAGSPDTYMSQSRFSGRRLVTRLVTVSSLWVDIDYYGTVRHAGSTAMDVLAALLARCDEERIPAPSYVISTGRGICAVWLHEPVGRQVEPRWRAAEVGLCDRFEALGMDRAPRHPAAVFRLLGSKNSKNDQDVRCIYPEVGEPVVYSFEELFGLFAPVAEPVLDRPPPRVRRGEHLVHAIRVAATEGRTVGPWALWGRRLDDLQALRELRWFGPLPPGHRDKWLFLCACALPWMVPVGSLRREIIDLGREAIGGRWSDRAIETDMGSAIRRAEAAARGELTEWPPGSGEKVDPRYRFKDRTIVEWLDITPAELAQLPPGGQLGPHSLAVRLLARRRLGGLVSGRKRRERVSPRDAEMAGWRAAGWSLQRIGDHYGVSEGAVRKALIRVENGR